MRCAGAFGRCLLIGEWSASTTGSKTWFCAWHAIVLRDPKHATLDDFTRFHERMVKYCSVWAHYTGAELWGAIDGVRPGDEAAPCSIRCTLWLSSPAFDVKATPPALVS